ncbi:MAG TPA: hypothetical protein VFY92_09700 [Hyphomicrobiaceae bacterium]|nr:hypothetical protein [Hyphomicrobiaceae bacterium]
MIEIIFATQPRALQRPPYLRTSKSAQSEPIETPIAAVPAGWHTPRMRSGPIGIGMREKTQTRLIGHRPRLVRLLSMDALAAVVLTGLWALATVAEETDTPAGIIAAQIRAQGYGCSPPVAATRDRQETATHDAVWILTCSNARYRVRLVPDMAAEVTQLE